LSRRRRGAAVALVLVAALAAVVFWPEPPPGPVGGWMAAAGVTPLFETVAGTRVRYVRRGSGPPVLLIHGFASSLYTWKDVLPVLAASHDVVALDMPAHGESDVPGEMRAALFPQVAVGLMDRLGLERASLVGNSLGGAVAVAVAAHHPTRVDRLVLIDAAGYNFAQQDRPWILRLAGATRGGTVLERLPVQRRLATTALRQVVHDDRLVTADRVDEYVTPLERPGVIRALGALLASGGDLGFPGIVGSVRAPTLVVWGREDRWIPVEHAERFAAALPGSRVEVIDGCGHMPQEERPEDVARLVAAFLASPAAPAPAPAPAGR
jgi:pimeloyl-ACP methyl ester carboxylesterase